MESHLAADRIPRHGGKCPDVCNRSTDNGGDLVQRPCTGGANQHSSRAAA
ncbi:hypothetical protein GCM10027447_18400 [Glycomyces halotolerans]